MNFSKKRCITWCWFLWNRYGM